MGLIADEKILFRSPDPAGIYCFTPGLLVGGPGANGRNRLIAVCDFGGPGIRALEGPTSPEGDGAGNQIRVKYSDDGGETWLDSPARLPFRHEILFRAGDALYMIGNDCRLVISRSTDNGETWSDPAVLAEGRWHQSCGAVAHRNGNVYLVYEQYQPNHAWPGVMPVFMAARETDDLLRRDAWRFSAPYDPDPDLAALKAAGVLTAEVPGILETNVLDLDDPALPFGNRDGRTFALCMRLESGLGNLGVMMTGREAPDGTLAISRGDRCLVPIPGGCLKFHIQFDAPSGLFWMAASQLDGVMHPRRRLGLYRSKNLQDWICAGTVAVGPCDHGARHYATLAIDGGDLLILSRSGDENACSAHNNDLQTLHRVRDFRKLAEPLSRQTGKGKGVPA